MQKPEDDEAFWKHDEPQRCDHEQDEANRLTDRARECETGMVSLQPEGEPEAHKGETTRQEKHIEGQGCGSDEQIRDSKRSLAPQEDRRSNHRNDDVENREVEQKQCQRQEPPEGRTLLAKVDDLMKRPSIEGSMRSKERAPDSAH